MKNFLTHILFILLSVFNYSAMAQSTSSWEEEDIKTHLVQVNLKEGFASFEVAYSEISKKYKPNLYKTYYWYASNEMHQTQGGFEGRLLHGKYTSYYSSSENLREKGGFKKGLKDGIWFAWYPDGKLKQHYEWKEGLLNGPFEEYSPENNLTKKGTYKNDELNGKYTEYEGGHEVLSKRYRNGKEIVPKAKAIKQPKQKAQIQAVDSLKTPASGSGKTVHKSGTFTQSIRRAKENTVTFFKKIKLPKSKQKKKVPTPEATAPASKSSVK